MNALEKYILPLFALLALFAVNSAIGFFLIGLGYKVVPGFGYMLILPPTVFIVAIIVAAASDIHGVTVTRFRRRTAGRD